jgi:hypothetical protein
MPTHVLMETCGTAHFRARVVQTHGHRVNLLRSAWPSSAEQNRPDRRGGALEARAADGSWPYVKTVVQRAAHCIVRDQWMAPGPRASMRCEDSRSTAHAPAGLRGPVG